MPPSKLQPVEVGASAPIETTGKMSASGTYDETSSKAVVREETVKIWSLGGWRQRVTVDDLKLILLDSTCNVELDSPRAQFQFHFEERHSDFWATGSNGEPMKIRTEWLTVWVKPMRRPETTPAQYGIDMEAVEDKNIGLQIRGQFSEKTILHPEFIKLREQTSVTNLDGTVTSVETLRETFSHRGDLNLRITVTPIFVVNAENVPVCPDLTYSLLRVRKGMRGEADLALEMKNGEVILAHKQVLAGGSARFQNILEKGLEVRDSGGMDRLHLPDTSSTMRIILYWLYAGKLHVTAPDCIGVLVEVANRYELNELSRELEKTLMQVCTRENMYEFLKLAEKYGMVEAAMEMAKFIKAEKKKMRLARYIALLEKWFCWDCCRNLGNCRGSNVPNEERVEEVK